MSAIAACLGFAPSFAADIMVGVVPSDGIAMLVKRFAVSDGATIVGAEFRNNDPRTVFPEVELVQGCVTSVSQGTVVARVTNVSETATGLVSVVWPQLVQVTRGGDFYVCVRVPEGPGKQGPGNGPALGADRVVAPNGSFLAGGVEGILTPAGVDLSIALLGAQPAKTAAAIPSETERGGSGFLLRITSPVAGHVEIEFNLQRPAYVEVAIYNVAGRLLRLLAEGPMDAGTHSVHWDSKDGRGQDVAAGVYVAMLHAGDKVLTKKMVIAK